MYLRQILTFFARRSRSVGMVITGSTYVHPLGKSFAESFSGAEDDKIEGLSRLAKAIKDQGALAIVQLYHGGRMVLPDLIDGQPSSTQRCQGSARLSDRAEGAQEF